MRTLPPALLALALLVPPPAAAHCGHCGGEGSHDASAAPAAAPQPAKSAFRPMGRQVLSGAPSLEAARAKFASTVEGYVASRSEDGVWELQDEKGRARRLTFVSADKASVVESGQGRYTGRAKFKEGKRPVEVELTIEPGGQFWKVVDARLAAAQKKN